MRHPGFAAVHRHERLVPALFEGYSMASQTVSELSPVGAPTRPLWVGLGALYALLMCAFGWGALTGFEGPKISADLPTPWIGVWERISIAAFLAWVGALAIKLLPSPA
jgi:hypothetical protein